MSTESDVMPWGISAHCKSAAIWDSFETAISWGGSQDSTFSRRKCGVSYK